VQAVRKAILEMLANDEKRREMGKKAREFVLQHCDAEVYAQQLYRFMTDLHEGGRK
jgi:glycosyltransferase involved in cell wall biosynthesis